MYPSFYEHVDHPSVESDDACPSCGAASPADCDATCGCSYCAERCRECKATLFDDERARGTCARCYGDALSLDSERGAA